MRINIKISINAGLAVFILVSASCLGAVSAKQPNVIFIMADGQPLSAQSVFGDSMTNAAGGAAAEGVGRPLTGRGRYNAE